MKLLKLAEKYAAGKADPSDFAGLSPKQVVAIRTDPEMGCNHIAVTSPLSVADAGPRRTLAEMDDEEDDPIPYVMITEHPIGKMKDIYRVNGFGFAEFDRRKRPLLYCHLFEPETRPTLGNMSRPTRHRKFDGLKAMHGYADFAPRGIYDFADMVQDLVRSGVMTGGSIGMDIKDARAPKDEKECERLECLPYSLIIEVAELQEFSVCPMGKDPNAQSGVTLSMGAEDAALAMLVDGVRTGRYDRAMVAALREITPGLMPPLRILSNGISLPGEDFKNPNQEDTDMQVDPKRVEALEAALAELKENQDQRLDSRDEERDATIAALEDRVKELEGCIDQMIETLGAEKPDESDDDEGDETEFSNGRALYEELIAVGMNDDEIEALLDKGDSEAA